MLYNFIFNIVMETHEQDHFRCLRIIIAMMSLQNNQLDRTECRLIAVWQSRPNDFADSATSIAVFLPFIGTHGYFLILPQSVLCISRLCGRIVGESVLSISSTYLLLFSAINFVAASCEDSSDCWLCKKVDTAFPHYPSIAGIFNLLGSSLWLKRLWLEHLDPWAERRIKLSPRISQKSS